MRVDPSDAGAPTISGELPRLAFISSVITPELRAVRKRVVGALQAVPFLLPWAFEMTPASSEDVGDDYLRKVREATLVLWFAGGTTTDPVEMEINEALAAQKRLLVFILPAEERDERTEELIEKMRPHGRFRRLADLDRLEPEVEAAVSDELARALDGEPSMSRAERIDSLGRESLARCIQKWQAARVDLALARELANDITVGAVPLHLLPSAETPFVALVAEAGSGKSLACERVLQAAIASQLKSATEPVPVFVTARDAVGELKATVLGACEGLGDPRRCGAVVLIDGADEAAGGAALLLAEARELAHAWPRTQVLLSTRPLTQFDHIPEARKLPRLSEAQARDIVALGAGRPISIGEQVGWSLPTKDAAAVPLFALLIGRHIAERGDASGATRITLLADLAERALVDSSVDARPPLHELAVKSIARAGGRVPRSELGGGEVLKQLEASRLIASGDGEVWFPLALLAQWFAAESLAEGEPSGKQLASAPVDLELWRYPLAILAATAGHRQTLAVFGPLARAHPGFVSQVVDESIVRWSGSRGSAPPRHEAGMRIREAMTHWLSGLDPLSSILQPRFAPGTDRLPPVGLEVENQRLLVGWYAGTEEQGDVVDLPIGLRLGKSNAAEAASWPRLRGATPPRQASWALRWTFDELAHQLEYKLNERLLPLEGTELEPARLWRAARGVLGLPDTQSLPISTSAVMERARELADSSDEVPHRTQLHPIDLEKLTARLRELLADGIDRLSPPPLEVEPSGRLVIPRETQNEIALDHVHAVYQAALSAYSELTDSLFRPLRPFMQIATLLPASLRGHIYLSGDPGTGKFTEYIEWWLDPLPPGEASRVDISAPAENEPRHRFMEGWDEEAERAIARARSYRPEQARWIDIFLISHELRAHGPLAPEEIVYGWLWDDLKRIKWVKGQIVESHYKTLP